MQCSCFCPAGLSFTLHQLSCHPEVQQRLVAEVDALYASKAAAAEAAGGAAGADAGAGPDPDALSPSDLEQLPYTEAVFKEALRLFPPGGGLLLGLGPAAGACCWHLRRCLHATVAVAVASRAAGCNVPSKLASPPQAIA
jgi:hypothetical protein